MHQHLVAVWMECDTVRDSDRLRNLHTQHPSTPFSAVPETNRLCIKQVLEGSRQVGWFYRPVLRRAMMALWSAASA